MICHFITTNAAIAVEQKKNSLAIERVLNLFTVIVYQVTR